MSSIHHLYFKIFYCNMNNCKKNDLYGYKIAVKGEFKSCYLTDTKILDSRIYSFLIENNIKNEIEYINFLTSKLVEFNRIIKHEKNYRDKTLFYNAKKRFIKYLIDNGYSYTCIIELNKDEKSNREPDKIVLFTFNILGNEYKFHLRKVHIDFYYNLTTLEQPLFVPNNEMIDLYKDEKIDGVIYDRIANINSKNFINVQWELVNTNLQAN